MSQPPDTMHVEGWRGSSAVRRVGGTPGLKCHNPGTSKNDDRSPCLCTASPTLDRPISTQLCGRWGTLPTPYALRPTPPSISLRFLVIPRIKGPRGDFIPHLGAGPGAMRDSAVAQRFEEGSIAPLKCKRRFGSQLIFFLYLLAASNEVHDPPVTPFSPDFPRSASIIPSTQPAKE